MLFLIILNLILSFKDNFQHLFVLFITDLIVYDEIHGIKS